MQKQTAEKKREIRLVKKPPYLGKDGVGGSNVMVFEIVPDWGEFKVDFAPPAGSTAAEMEAGEKIFREYLEQQLKSGRRPRWREYHITGGVVHPGSR
jgi:hypothetical protein